MNNLEMSGKESRKDEVTAMEVDSSSINENDTSSSSSSSLLLSSSSKRRKVTGDTKGNNSSSVQLPFVEKYRPKRLEDLVAHDDIVSILTKFIDNDNLPHLLFYGPPGTGKTSTIVAAAKRMYGGSAAYSSMALELNASDARGIDVRTYLSSPSHSFCTILHYDFLFHFIF